MKLSQEYRVLVEKVRKIDEDAAEFLLHEVPKMESWVDVGDLASCFLWKASPQRRLYWANIDETLVNEIVE